MATWPCLPTPMKPLLRFCTKFGTMTFQQDHVARPRTTVACHGGRPTWPLGAQPISAYLDDSVRIASATCNENLSISWSQRPLLGVSGPLDFSPAFSTTLFFSSPLRFDLLYVQQSFVCKRNLNKAGGLGGGGSSVHEPPPPEGERGDI